MDIIKYNSLRLKGINAKLKELPMKYFTQDGMNPSESTILLIKKFAYEYNLLKKNSNNSKTLCFN